MGNSWDGCMPDEDSLDSQHYPTRSGMDLVCTPCAEDITISDRVARIQPCDYVLQDSAGEWIISSEGLPGLSVDGHEVEVCIYSATNNELIVTYTLPGDTTIGKLQQRLLNDFEVPVFALELARLRSSEFLPINQKLRELPERAWLSVDKYSHTLKLSIMSPVALYSTSACVFRSTAFDPLSKTSYHIPYWPPKKYCMAVDWASSRVLVGLELWDVGSMRLLCGAQETSPVSYVCIDWASCQVLSVCDNNMFNLWKRESSAFILVKTFRVHTRAVVCFDVDWAHNRALSASKDGTLQDVDLDQGLSMHAFHGHTSWVQCFSVDWAENRALSGGADATLRLWDVSTGESIKEIAAQDSIVQRVAMDWLMQRAISSGMGTAIRIWDLSTSQCIGIFSEHSSWVNCFSVHWSSKRVCSGDAIGVLNIWNFETLQPMSHQQACTESITEVAVNWNINPTDIKPKQKIPK